MKMLENDTLASGIGNEEIDMGRSIKVEIKGILIFLPFFFNCIYKYITRLRL